MRKGFLMGFLFHGRRQVHLLIAALLVMVGMSALAVPTMALDGPVLGSALQVVDGTPEATPDVVDDTAEDDGSVAALPATGDGASQDDGANPLAITAVGLVTIVALGFLGLRLVGRRV